MLHYNEKEKRDPDVFKYAIKCGTVVLSFMMTIVLLYSLSTYMLNGYSTFSHVLAQGLSYFGIWISELKQIVNKTAVLYSMWASLALVVWSLCIMLKIKQDCQKTKKTWKRLNKMFILISTILTFFTIYMLFSEASVFLINTILTFWILITVVNVLSYIGDESAYREFHNIDN